MRGTQCKIVELQHDCMLDLNYMREKIININFKNNIKTHGSESRGQEEAGLRDEPVSYLQVAPL